MQTVGIKLLKNRLSEYVRAAEAGETVRITDRDRVVAELVPPRTSEAPSVDEVIAQGVREGWLTPAEIPHTDPIPTFKGNVPFDQLMADLERDREDR